MKDIFHMMKYISNLKLVFKLEPELPTLYYKKDGLFNDTVTTLEQLQQQYNPTPWLRNHHIHLMFFDVIKKNLINLKYDSIEQLTMTDGGITAVVWIGSA